MVHPAPANPGFQGRAHHPMGLPALERGQERPGVALQERPVDLPSRPACRQSRGSPQRFIQGHRHPGRQGLQTLLIQGRKRLLQPLQSGFISQSLRPNGSRGPIPAPIGIEPERRPSRQPLQEQRQQLQLLTGGQSRYLPFEGRGR